MPENTNMSSSYLQYLQDGGEMGELTRSYDWSKTVIGHPDKWSQSLLTTLSIILKSKFPMFLWWGTELIQFYNDAYRPSLGNEGKHPLALGQHGEDCWPEIWPEIKPMIDQVMISGESTWDEDRLIPIYRNGHMEDVYWTFGYSQVNDGTGKTGGVLVICNETTEKVKSFADLKEAKQGLELAQKDTQHQRDRIERFFIQAPVGICVLDGENLAYEMLNPLYQQLFPGRELLGKPLFEAIPEIKGQPIAAILKEVYDTGITYEGNELLIPLVRNEGGLIKNGYFNFIYQARLDAKGVIDGIIVCAFEVTEQVNSRNKAEESEKKFRQVADSVIQMIWVTDGEGMHEYYNQRWYDFTGTDYEQVKGAGWNQMFHPDDRERAWETWKHSLETGTPYEIEYRLRNKSGDYIWVLGRAAPFYDSNGSITKWFGTCTDINEQKLLMQQKDDFISIASHELKTPITTLTASLQLLDRMKDNSSAKMFPTLIERANKSLDKVNQLIKDLLNVTQFNNGQLHLNKSWVTLSSLIEDCCPDIRAEDIYTLNTKGDLDLKVYADAQRIGQVIVNFVNNAIKYASDSKDILIFIEQVNNTAKLSVTDRGKGIAAEKIPHLFDRYFRVDSKGSQYSGLGLGLYISAEIIRKHDGQIGADSEVGKGSTFWFSLPL
jgi:two-component system sensor histidine kinase VicK